MQPHIFMSLHTRITGVLSTTYPLDAQSLWNISDKYSVKAIKAGNLNIQKDVNVRKQL